jgi:hypothetical protein
MSTAVMSTPRTVAVNRRIHWDIVTYLLSPGRPSDDQQPSALDRRDAARW